MFSLQIIICDKILPRGVNFKAFVTETLRSDFSPGGSSSVKNNDLININIGRQDVATLILIAFLGYLIFTTVDGAV